MNAISANFSGFARFFGLLTLFCLGLLQPPGVEAAANRAFRRDRLIILPRNEAAGSGLHALSSLNALHAHAGRRVLNTYASMGGLQVVQLAPGETLEEVMASYQSSGLVQFAEPDYKIHATLAPNDPDFVNGVQWSLRNTASPGHDISAMVAWDTLTSASNVVVAIVDSGIRVTHEDLAANLWTNPNEIPDNGIDDDGDGIIDDVHGMNAINLNGDLSDEAGHGTHVAGIIGAVGNNGVGISGVAWSVKLMACKFLDANGDGETSDAIRCIDYARKNGANIINASWGGTEYSAALFTAIANARAAGVIVVTAAGNDSANIDRQPLYPACYNLDNIVVVGGTTSTDVLDNGYSSYGPMNVDLCAPGTLIYSTWNTGDSDYSYLSGTSMAAPHVSGALALMKARFPSMSSSDLISRLLATVDVLPSLTGKCKTGGRLNLARALGTDPTANFLASKLAGEPPLSVAFTNLTFGAIQKLWWDFGDNTPIVTNNNPTHIFAGGGIFDVRLTVVGTNLRTNSFDQVVQVTPNYEIISEPYAWVDPSGMTPLSLTDNGVSDAQSLLFPFTLYGQSYDSIYVGANGILGFDPTGMDTTVNSSIPANLTPNAILCPYWDNLNPAAGGNIYAGYVGDAPARRFVVSWVNVPRDSTLVAITFQAILEEGSSEIVYQYLDTQPATSRGGAKRATIGVESASGTTGAQYTFDGIPHVLTNQMALRIRPKAYRYLVAGNSPILLDAPFGFPVANVTNGLHISNPGTLPLNWSLSANQDWVALPQTSGSLLPGESALLPISLSAAAGSLSIGSYSAVLTLKNTIDAKGNTTIPLQLNVEQPQTLLGFANISGNAFIGGLGGPFNPTTLTINLQNSGNIPLTWAGTADAGWITLDPADGTIDPGAVEPVSISLSTDAQTFGSGTNNAVIRFVNGTDPNSSPLQQLIQVQVRSRLEQASASLANGVFSGALLVPQGGGYQVEYSDDLQSWLPLATNPVVSGAMLKFQDLLNGTDRRFYRVRIE